MQKKLNQTLEGLPDVKIIADDILITRERTQTTIFFSALLTEENQIKSRENNSEAGICSNFSQVDLTSPNWLEQTFLQKFKCQAMKVKKKIISLFWGYTQ